MHLPADLRYAKTHEWARLDSDGCLTIGITDHAQNTLGDIVFLQLPSPGSAVKSGTEVAMIESVKAASGIHAPVNGTITAVNEAVVDAPESINEDAYSAWLFRLQPDAADDFHTQLLDAKNYENSVE